MWTRGLAAVAFCLACGALAADEAQDARLKAGAANHARTTGDKELAAGNYKKALEQFDKAIELNPTDHTAYFKRSTAYQIAGKMTQCHADLSKAIQLSPDFVQGIGKKAKLLVQDAEFDAARALYERLLELRQGDQKAMQTLQDIEKGRQYLAYSKDLFAQNRHEEAVAYLDPLLEIAPNCIDARLMRANGQHLLGRPEGVLADTGKVLKMQPSNLPALRLRAEAYYLMNEHDVAKRHYGECLRFDPDDAKCKMLFRQIKKMDSLKKSANDLMEAGQAREALQDIHNALAVDPRHSLFNIELHMMACKAHVALAEGRAAVTACDQVLQMNDRMGDAWVYKSKAKLVLELWDEAVHDAQKAHEIDNGNQQYADQVNEANKRLKMSKRKDYYKVLGVANDATERDLKRAYHKLALEFHPDKVAAEQKEDAEKKFREIAEAHEVLSNPELRQKFDNGEDLEETPQPQGHQQFHHGGQTFHFHFG